MVDTVDLHHALGFTDEEIAKLSAADPAPAASGGNGATAPARAATEADDVIPF